MERDTIKNMLVILPVATAMAIAGHYLYRDLKGQANSELTEDATVAREPMGYISYTNNSVTRKSETAAYWSDIKTQEYVYDRDTIRTGSLAGTQIVLNDSSVLDVSENSLIVLQKSSDLLTVDLKLGDLVAKGKTDQLSIKVDDKTLSAKGASLQAKLDGSKNAQINVRDGKVKITDTKGTRDLDKQQMVTIDRTGKMETTTLSVILRSPVNKTVLMSPDTQSTGLFTWDVSDTKMPDTVFEVSSDIDFPEDKTWKTIGRLTQQAPIKRGKNYWRVSWRNTTGKTQYSETWMVNLENDTRVKQTAPVNQATFDLSPQENQIEFGWESKLPVASYLLETSESQEFTKIRSFDKIEKPPYTVKGLPNGAYYWRIRALDKDNKELARSAAWFFSLRTTLPQLPDLKAPAHLFRWTLNEPLLFEWVKNPAAKSYRLTIAKTANLKDVVKSLTVADHSYMWSWTQPGQYFWGVESIDENNVVIGESLRYRVDISPPIGGIGITLLAPKDQTLITRERRVPVDPISFEWRPDRDIEGAYSLKIGKSPDLKDAKVFPDLMSRRLTESLDKSGTYFWKVTWTNPLKATETLESPVFAFKLKVQTQLLPVQLLAPLADEKLYINEEEPVSFSWNKSSEAKSYRLVIERVRVTDPIVEENSSNNYSIALDKTLTENKYDALGLEHGTYRWTVYPIDATLVEGTPAVHRIFKLDAERGLAAPKLKPAVVK